MQRRQKRCTEKLSVSALLFDPQLSAEEESRFWELYPFVQDYAAKRSERFADEVADEGLKLLAYLARNYDPTRNDSWLRYAKTYLPMRMRDEAKRLKIEAKRVERKVLASEDAHVDDAERQWSEREDAQAAQLRAAAETEARKAPLSEFNANLTDPLFLPIVSAKARVQLVQAVSHATAKGLDRKELARAREATPIATMPVPPKSKRQPPTDLLSLMPWVSLAQRELLLIMTVMAELTGPVIEKKTLRETLGCDKRVLRRHLAQIYAVVEKFGLKSAP